MNCRECFTEMEWHESHNHWYCGYCDKEFENLKYAPIEDGNSDFSQMELADDGNIGRVTPHCKKHRAMSKVSNYYWRCLYLVLNLNTGNNSSQCRTGCKEIQNE